MIDQRTLEEASSRQADLELMSISGSSDPEEVIEDDSASLLPVPAAPSKRLLFFKIFFPILLVLVIVAAGVVISMEEGPHDFRPRLLSSTFGDDMVLQRDVPNELFGWAETPNLGVELDFNGTEKYATSTATSPDYDVFVSNGDKQYYRWTITLPPLASTTYASSITVKTATFESASISNILFGDVYLCSGQSNMQFPATLMFGYQEEVRDIPSLNDRVRIFNVGQDINVNYGGRPSAVLSSVLLPWSVVTAETLSFEGRGTRLQHWFSCTFLTTCASGVSRWIWNPFSAVCYTFGKEMFLSSPLNGTVPIGLIESSWGGTNIKQWIPSSSRAACYSGVGNGNSDPSFLYDTMLHPFSLTSLKGFLWYQGESNARHSTPTDRYDCMLHALVASIRSFQHSSAAAFLHVQLGTWTLKPPSLLPAYRLASRAFCDGSEGSGEADERTEQGQKDDKCGFATAADLGDIKSPYGAIHPREKREIGRRLAAAARDVVYNDGEKVRMRDGDWRGPIVEDISIVNGVVRILFEDGSVGKNGIEIRKGQRCPWPVVCAGFRLQMEGGAVLDLDDDDDDILTKDSFRSVAIALPPDVDPHKVAAIEMGQNAYPIIKIFNSGGFPLLPFVFTSIAL